jgi:hypothetical protein
MTDLEPIDELPGAELVLPGLADLAAGDITINALLVLIARSRLEALGFNVAPGPAEPNLTLYRRLAATHGNDAHQAYNALISRLMKFEDAAERRATLRRRRSA